MKQETNTIEVIGPVLITVAEAERLCSIPATAGYKLIERDWKPFVVRYGERGIRINRARLLEWAAGKRGAA